MAVVLLALTAVIPMALSAASTETRWSFDDAQTGTLPAWLDAPVGKWEVRETADSPVGKRALFQAAKNSGSTFNMAVDRAARFQDLELTVRMKAVAGAEDQGGGLVWRYRDARNYYIARYNPLEDNYRVYKVVNGSRRELASASVKPAPGWHQLTIRMSGKHLTCDLDGKTYLTADDGSFPDTGAVGVWTKADAQTLFAGLEARALP
jgi:hypothetical protein